MKFFVQFTTTLFSSYEVDVLDFPSSSSETVRIWISNVHVPFPIQLSNQYDGTTTFLISLTTTFSNISNGT